MKVIYVAGPYRDPTEIGLEENIRHAEALALTLWKDGWAVFCPHKNTAHFGGACPDEVWLEGDLEILRRCDAICLTHDWEDSTGARREYDEAIKLGIPVYCEYVGGEYDEWK